MNKTVNSSVINSASYDNGNLTVNFKKGNTTTFLNVPESEYKNLTEAASVGGYFNSHIKPNYKTA